MGFKAIVNATTIEQQAVAELGISCSFSTKILSNSVNVFVALLCGVKYRLRGAAYGLWKV